MSSTFDTSKRPDKAPEAGSTRRSSIAPSSGRKESRTGTGPPYLVALALVFSAGMLLWLLRPEPPDKDAYPMSEPVSRGQLQSANKSRLHSFAVRDQKPAPWELDQEGELVYPMALEGGKPLDPPPELLYVAPSLERARTVTLELETPYVSEPVPRAPTAEELAGLPGRRLNRSQARSIALADLTEHLPRNYLTAQSQPAVAVSAGTPDRHEWPDFAKPDKSAKLPTQPATDEKGAKKPDATASEEPLRFEEIPSRIRDSIPMSISMLVYSKRPDDRWANIDGSKMREGDQMPSGLRVEQITSEGIVFNYQGHSFYKAVKN